MSKTQSTPQPVDQARARLGEGPVWDERRGELFWIDILNRRVHRFDPAAGRSRVYDLDDIVGCVALTGDESLIVALRHRLVRLDLQSGAAETLVEVEAGRDDNKLNDGKVDARGRLWFGSFSQNEGGAALYRYDPDGSLHVMQDGMTGSNGLGWSPDGRTFYLTDSGERRIYAYDFDVDRGAISNRRVLVDLSGSTTPDGLAVDAEGHIWSAQFDGGHLLRFSPDGREISRLELPVKITTSCAFGGAELRELYVTTASVGLSEGEIDEHFHSGDLFRVRVNATGLPFYRFGE